MIRDIFRVEGSARRPFVTARLTLPAQGIAGDVQFLVDTGADATVLAPVDALFLGVNLAQLPAGPLTTGIGGRTHTAQAAASITLGLSSYHLSLRVLAPTSPAQQRALRRIPSLLGRDMLSHFALFIEQRTDRVLLLEPHEAAALPLP